MHTNRDWKPIKTYREILLDEWEGIARITINRPHVRNAFTPLTTWEMSDALRICNESPRLRVVLLTGADSPRKEGQSAGVGRQRMGSHALPCAQQHGGRPLVV